MSKKSTKKPISKAVPSSKMASKSVNNSTLKKTQKTQKLIPKLKRRIILKIDPKAIVKISFSTVQHHDKWMVKKLTSKTR
jgi:hypothetical protein